MRPTMTCRDLPIQLKLRLIIMLTVGAALALACLAILTYDRFAFRRSMQRDLAMLAEMVGSNSTAAISFGDQKTAAELLAGLKANPHIVDAHIFSDDGSQFASYTRDPASTPDTFCNSPAEGSWFTG